MAVVHFVRKVPLADGTLVPASGFLYFTPTARRVITGTPDVVVLPVGFQVPLVGGVADVTLAPSTGAWVWRVQESVTGTTSTAYHVAVPNVAELDDTDLVRVDPATLEPVAVDSLAWVTTIGAVFHVSDTAPTETTRHGVPVIWIETADVTAPSAVTNLVSGTATETTVPLSWTAATDNTAVTGYEYSLNGTTWTATGSTGTTYTVTGLTAGTAYAIQVRAFDAAGNKGAAVSVTATTAASTADTTAPAAPTNLAGTAGATTMDLSWTASTDAVGVTGYRVSKDNGATWITSTVTGTTYQVTGLTASTSYTFAVAARDAAGNWSTNATLVKSTTAATPALTQVFLDTFTGPDGAFTGHLADTGQSWAGSTANAAIAANRLDPSASVVYATHGAASPVEGLADMTAPTAGSTIVSFRAPASATLDGSLVNITSGGLVSFGGGSVSPATITFNNGRATATDNYTAIPGFVAGGTYAVKMTWSGSTVTVYIGGTRLLEGTYSAAQMTTIDTYRSVQVQADGGGYVDNIKVSA